MPTITCALHITALYGKKIHRTKLSRVSQGESASNKSSRVVKELALNDSGKQPSAAHSMLISSSADVLNGKFITDLYDYDM